MTTPGQIQSPSLWAKVTRNLGIKQRSITPELGNVAHPVIILEDHSVKNVYDVTTERPAGAGTIGGAVAAQNTWVGIFNPQGSGIIARVDLVILSVTLAQDVQLSLEAISQFPGTGQVAWWRDRRLAINANDRGAIDTLQTGNQALTANRPVARFVLPANGSLLIQPTGIILSPGTGFYAVGLTVNTSLDATMWWSEINEKP